MTNQEQDIDYVVQIKYMRNQDAYLAAIHLIGLGYDAEVIKMMV